MFHKPKDILKKSNYSRTREVYSMIETAYKEEIAEEKEFADDSTLNARMVEGKYKVPILKSLDNRFFFEQDKYFKPSPEEVDDVHLRKNAQNCMKILFDFTNLKYKDIFRLLTDDYSCQLWINDVNIDPEKHAVKLACLALGLDKIFAEDEKKNKKGKGLFQSVKKNLDKLIHMNKSYEQKATIFSLLIEKNKALQEAIFSRLKTKPCKYSAQFETRFDAKMAEKKAKKAKNSTIPTTPNPAYG